MLEDTQRQIARSSMFFGSLPEDVFDVILSRSRVIPVSAGQAIFHQGEDADAIFAVLTGMVKLVVSKRDGTEAVVETFGAGTSFAEALAFETLRYPVSASAIVDSTILRAPCDLVKKAVLDNPDAFGAILAATYTHLHQLVRQVEQLKSNSGFERLGRYVLARADEAGSSNEIIIPYEKQLLASLLGMKPETLSRAFRKLRDIGVSVDGPSIRVDDLGALRKELDAD